MNAVNDPPVQESPASQPDQDALYAEFIARAEALQPGQVAAADALIADIVQSGLSEATFKLLADAIAKATGFDAKAYLDQMKTARKKLQKNGADHEADDAAAAAPPRTQSEL